METGITEKKKKPMENSKKSFQQKNAHKQKSYYFL